MKPKNIGNAIKSYRIKQSRLAESTGQNYFYKNKIYVHLMGVKVLVIFLIRGKIFVFTKELFQDNLILFIMYLQ